LLCEGKIAFLFEDRYLALRRTCLGWGFYWDNAPRSSAQFIYNEMDGYLGIGFPEIHKYLFFNRTEFNHLGVTSKRTKAGFFKLQDVVKK